MAVIRNENGDKIDFIPEKYFSLADNQPWECWFVRVVGSCGFVSFDTIVEMSSKKLQEFYEKAYGCYKQLKGSFLLTKFSYDEDISVGMGADTSGHIFFKMSLLSHRCPGTDCNVLFYTDQTFVATFLQELKNQFNL